MAQTQTIRLVVFGVVFFLAAAVVFDLTEIAANTDYWFHQLPEDGIFLLVLDALNLVAIYGAWRRNSWGYILAIVLALVIALPTVQDVMFLAGNLQNPAGAFYTITMIVIRLMIVFFAASTLILLRRPST